jgi:hypothetical protein
MAKIKVEFINTCPCCDEYGRLIQAAAAKYEGQVDVQFYRAGQDFEYVRKYGTVTKGTMIVNGRKKYDTLSGETIEKAIEEAVKGCGCCR